jgi:hypothetical protein
MYIVCQLGFGDVHWCSDGQAHGGARIPRSNRESAQPLRLGPRTRIVHRTRKFNNGVEDNEENEGRDSPQAPPALLSRLLRGPLGIVGVKGRQELGTRPGNRIHR